MINKIMGKRLLLVTHLIFFVLIGFLCCDQNDTSDENPSPHITINRAKL